MDTEYYLAGGTALALLLGHRQSMDFDWFIPKLGEQELLLNKLRSSDLEFEILSMSPETVYVLIDGIQVSFFGYDYPMLQQKLYLPEYSLHLAGTDDIACMKLSAIASRGSRKDFVDLHYLIKNFRSLEDYLGLYEKKFKKRDIGHVIRSLVYFSDAQTEPGIKTMEPLAWEDLESDFEEWVLGLKI